MQHIKEDDSTVNYFVTGAGHLTDPSTAHEVYSNIIYHDNVHINMHIISMIIAW